MGWWVAFVQLCSCSSSSPKQGGENGIENLWVEIRTGSSLVSFAHGSNWFDLGKIKSPIKMLIGKLKQHFPLSPRLSFTPPFLTPASPGTAAEVRPLQLLSAAASLTHFPCSRVAFLWAAALCGTITCSGAGSYMGCSVDICFIVASMGCRGISAPAPRAPPCLTEVLTGQFLVLFPLQLHYCGMANTVCCSQAD